VRAPRSVSRLAPVPGSPPWSPDDPDHDGNADQPWDDFDSGWYLAHNYEKLRSDDEQIIQWLADFFPAQGRRNQGHGIDVGTGTNLYPTLAMLPLCHDITMVERSRRNVGWLNGEVHGKNGFAETWDPFWSTLVQRQPRHYNEIVPRMALESRVTIEQGSIFELKPAQYDVGTMFFVAESITARAREFEKATRTFLGSLKRHAPFAAAFMKGSLGYRVGAYHFPAVAVHEKDIDECLDSVAYDVVIQSIPTTGNPLRDGYEGMILATGRAGSRK
jgi:hypothetical protein